jgi:hypothetical protein
MTVIRVRLCEQDRKTYGVDGDLLPDELTLDVDELLDLPAGELEALDRDLNMPIAAFIDGLRAWSLNMAQIRRVAAWLALRQHGRSVPYEEFQPRVLRGEFTRETDHPPAGTSEDSSEV